jgi:trigger factor
VAIDAVPMIGFILAEGHLLFNLNQFAEFNRLILRIANNRLAYSTSPWDIQLVGRRLIVLVAARQILVDVQFEPPNSVDNLRPLSRRNGRPEPDRDRRRHSCDYQSREEECIETADC